MSTPKVVLVTGAASGIGKSTAIHLAKAGYTVYASARSEAQLADLAAAGCRTVALDVADEASRVAAIARIAAEAGPVGILVNNAGYSQSGAVEEIPLDRWQRQFDTNVFGLVRMCQLVLPGMRAQGWGKIVNIGSMGGTLTFPGGGAYHASKYAVEAISDALRFEVKAFGVDVVLVQPGLIRTGFADAVGHHIAPATTGGPYGGFSDAVAKSTVDAYEKGPLAAISGTPEDVARVVAKAVTVASPRARYTVSGSATLLMTQRRMMPDWAWDAFLRASFPQPGVAPLGLAK
ncbi:MAG: SDR family NAD(P)-dependent oxidoreductase [Pseudomonadota bacterium]|nr:SDR family NAD(P)-dependent oxidoreductase [Pseudomonadota bacterium]